MTARKLWPHQVCMSFLFLPKFTPEIVDDCFLDLNYFDWSKMNSQNVFCILYIILSICTSLENYLHISPDYPLDVFFLSFSVHFFFYLFVFCLSLMSQKQHIINIFSSISSFSLFFHLLCRSFLVWFSFINSVISSILVLFFLIKRQDFPKRMMSLLFSSVFSFNGFKVVLY